MTILKNILIGVVGLVVILVVVGFFLPDSAHVERAAYIEAPAAAILPHANDLRAFNEWSPWADIDPDTQYQYSGPPSGKGAKVDWSSENPNVGTGSMEIDFASGDEVRYKLDFGPQGTADSYLRLEPRASGAGTQVYWGFDTEFGYDLMGRYFGLFLDEWVGGDYEKGLARLKDTVEGG